MFSVDTAIEEVKITDEGKVSAATKSAQTHAKVPRDHNFSLSLSQLERRHDDVEETACV